MNSIWLWLGLMCPLVLSPGPANLCLAGKASQSGFRSTLPLMAGFTTINILMTIGIGLLFSSVTQNLPHLFKILDLLGAIYVCYLSSCFFKIKEDTTVESSQKQNHFGYRSGVLFQLLNGKLYPTLIMMFTVFLGNEEHTLVEILTISFALSLLAFLSYISWSSLGTVLHRTLQGKTALFVQHYIFGGLLLLIGIKLLVHALTMFFN